MINWHHCRFRAGIRLRGVVAALALAGAFLASADIGRAASYEGERILTLDDIVPIPTPVATPTDGITSSVTVSPDAIDQAGADVSEISGAVDEDTAAVDAAVEAEAEADSLTSDASADGEIPTDEESQELSEGGSESAVVVESVPEIVSAPAPEMFDAPITSGDVIYDPTIYIRDENGNLVPMPGQGGIGVSSGSDVYVYDGSIIPDESQVYYQGSRVPPVGPTYYYDASPMYYYGPYGPYGMWGPSVGWGFWSRPDYHRPPRPRPPPSRPPGRPPRPPGVGRPPSGRPPSGRPPGVRPPGSRPPGVRPPGGRPPGGRPPGIRPPGGRPPGGRPPGGRPGGRPGGGQRPPRERR